MDWPQKAQDSQKKKIPCNLRMTALDTNLLVFVGVPGLYVLDPLQCEIDAATR